MRGPIVVTGLGRSGTTLLHELLACDPANRPPLLWELVHTVPGAAAADSGASDPSGTDWVATTHAEITLMDEMVPAFTAMHENGGHLPTECIFAFAHQFSSDQFIGIYNVPSYMIWKSGRRSDAHLRMAPAHAPDAPVGDPDRAVGREGTVASVRSAPRVRHLPRRPGRHHPPRPLRVVGSLADTMATLHWMHSDLRCPRDTDRVPLHGSRAPDERRDQRARLGHSSRWTRSPTSATGNWSPIRSAP